MASARSRRRRGGRSHRLSSTEKRAKEAFLRGRLREHDELPFGHMRAVLVVFKTDYGLRDLQWDLKDVVNIARLPIVSAGSTLCFLHFTSDRTHHVLLHKTHDHILFFGKRAQLLWP